MAMIEDKELASLFKVESAEHLARLDDGLLRLEKTPADQSLLEEVFRESHSLKGAARMLGLSGIETAAHGLETILNAARKGEAPLMSDAIERMTGVLIELRKLVELEYGVGSADCGIEPELRTPQSNNPQSAFPTPQSTEPFRIETVRVETRKLDDLLTLVGELSVIDGRVQHRLSLMDALLEQWAILGRSQRNAESGVRLADCGVEPEFRNQQSAFDLFGCRLKEARDAIYEDSARLKITADTLEEQVHAVRLLPLPTLFTLFPRMVRDFAREQGKEVELVIEGGDISVDKRILEEMKDPLMHLLRNALDHGIEPPAERERMGKPREGTVRLCAVRESSSVLLEVRDDGRGLNMEAIRQVALQRGLYDAATLAAMSPEQLQQLIFVPGFSTSTIITELSGRGVGLDVVRVNVERLKGDITMESVPNRGTVMQVRLPLSLATTRLLLVSVDGRVYGLPIEFVQTSRRVREEDFFTLAGHPAIEFDGRGIIAPHLADLLGLPAGSHGCVCIVLQMGDERMGLRVDDLLDEEEVVAKPLAAPLTRVRNVSCLAILGSGEICAVLNPSDLLRTAHKVLRNTNSVPYSARRTPQPDIPHSSCILLVEDSALVRAMEKRILEDAGYEVVAAADGLDALNALGRRSFSAVVSDINMPNMDGLTLTKRIRETIRYKDLPVILVTTLSSDEDKQRGLEAGANAYIPKPSFDQRALLDTLRRLI